MALSYTTDGTILSIEDIGVTLGGRKILNQVKANCQNIIRTECLQGQVVGLLGPSGAGKTTLFQIIAGFLKPDGGEVLIRKIGIEDLPGFADLSDRERLEPTTQGKVGVVTQAYRVFRHLTVLQNLVIAGRKGGLSKADATKKAEELLDRFGILDRKDLWPMSSQISGGQRQRVAIIQQLMAGHMFLCMDEPFSGLDPAQKQNVIKLIREVTSHNELLTIIVVTHDVGAAIAVADQLWLMGKRSLETGVPLDGARIVGRYDLIEGGLAWHDDVQSTPEFRTMVEQITERFSRLA